MITHDYQLLFFTSTAEEKISSTVQISKKNQTTIIFYLRLITNKLCQQ